MNLSRLAATLLLPLLLTSCFLSPGAFTSSLDIRKNGEFTFAYKGEIIYQSPDDIMKSESDKPQKWIDARARCYKDETLPSFSDFASEAEALADAADPQDDNRRSCLAEEIAPLQKQFEEQQAARLARKNKESSEFASMFGFNPSDDAANQKLAASLLKYDGWRAASYKGKGVFDVDYEIHSKVGHDFIFPLFPHVDIIIPFVQIRKRDEGNVMISAPALIGGGIKALAARAKALGQSTGEESKLNITQATRGTFTVTTDAEVITNNTDDGPVPEGKGRKLVWAIDPTVEKIPEALLKLK